MDLLTIRRYVKLSVLIRMLIVVSTASFFVPVTAAQEGELTAGMVNPGFEEKPDWFKLSFLDIREDIEEASANGKRVILYFYQDGCPYCAKLLQDNFSQRNIVEKTQHHFDVIAINLWGDREVIDRQGRPVVEKVFAENLKVMFTPTLLFLDEQGRVALRINGYYFPTKFDMALDYVSQGLERKVRFTDYVKQRAPVKASGNLHREADYLMPPYD